MPVTSDSVYKLFFTPDCANDGSMQSHTHSRLGTPAWWRVDLQDVYSIKKIVMYNTLSSSTMSRISGFQIKLSNSGSHSYSQARLCYTDTSSTSSVYEITSCNNGGAFSGRYVFVVKANNYLHFREFEVYAEYANVALNKPPIISSTVWSPDGYTNGNDGDYGTMTVSRGWWCVNLETHFNIDRIIINNKDTDSSINLLNGFKISLGYNDNCHAFSSSTPCYIDSSGVKRSYTVTGCNQGNTEFAGQTVFISNSNYIAFREMQVLIKAPTNLVDGKNILQSSTDGSLAVGLAIDDDTTTCSRTTSEAAAWWCVDLESNYEISMISLDTESQAFEVRLNTETSCNVDGFQSSVLCSSETASGNVFIPQCSSSTVALAARSVYFVARNNKIDVCNVKIYGDEIWSGCLAA
ncbi:hypothetical protein SNE40_000146 [Patella caerulea]